MIEYFNPNPTCKYFKSGKPKNWYINDSVVRAIAKALDISWDVSYDLLSVTAKQKFDMPTSKLVIDTILCKNGFDFVTHGKPSKNEKRPTVKEFIESISEKSKDIYVLNLADYFIAGVGNKFYDVSDKCLKNSVYSYWIKQN